MSAAPTSPPRLPLPRFGRRVTRVALWGLLVVLLVVAQSLLVYLTVRYEAVRGQEQVDAAAAGAAADVRQALSRHQQSLQALLWSGPAPERWRGDAAELLHQRRELMRLEWRDARLRIADALDSPYQAPLFTVIPREDKYKAKTFIDTVVYRAGDQIGSWSYLALSSAAGLGIAGIALVAMPLSALWVANSLWLGFRQARLARSVGAASDTATRS